jgi:hypothetical protein
MKFDIIVVFLIMIALSRDMNTLHEHWNSLGASLHIFSSLLCWQGSHSLVYYTLNDPLS